MPLIEGGYFITSRKLINSVIMDKPPEYLKVWIYLLGKAYHTPKNNLQRGQGFTSIPELQEMLSYYVGYRKEVPSKRKVWGILEWLRNPYEGNTRETMAEPMIETTKVTRGIIYTICKYDFYQNPNNYENNTEGNGEGTTKELRRERQGNNKYKNVKNYKNDNNISSCEEDEIKREPELKFPVVSTEYRLADYLRKHILKNNPKARVPGDNKMDSWSQHIDYMIRLDKRDPEDIKSVIEYCQKDGFWMTNILSTSKLRKQFDRLYLKSKQVNKQQNPVPKHKTKFHLENSRGDKYTADEIEELLLRKQRGG